MGGFGSGRHGGRATVEGCRSLVLDINRIMRPVAKALRGHELASDAEVRLRPSRLWWTRQGEAEPWADVEVALTLYCDHAVAVLRFDIEHWSNRTGPQVQRISIVTAPCRFGGQRWWWLCPRTGRRCAKLYLPNGGALFLSRGRGGYNLAYASQNGSAMDRSHARQRRLYSLLGGEYQYFEQPPPLRPRGMRHATYERMVSRISEAMEQHDEIFMAEAARFIGRVR